MKTSLFLILVSVMILPSALFSSHSEKKSELMSQAKVKSKTQFKARFDYNDYGRVLKKYTQDGWVDYKSLKKNNAELDSYLDRAAAVSEGDFKTWPRADQFSFYINLYNGATLKLILDHYPLKSIKDIGNIFSGPWKQEVVRLFEKKISLGELEHEILRPMGEPRIHFAINCASLGCPKLVAQPFLAATLEEQLSSVTKNFLKNTAKNRFNLKEKTIEISPIFKWFSEDFEKNAGSVRSFLLKYIDKDLRALVRNKDNEIDYTDYGWQLNEIENRL